VGTFKSLKNIDMQNKFEVNIDVARLVGSKMPPFHIQKDTQIAAF
jgi:hypothetical protein